MTADIELLPLPEPDYLMPQGRGWPDIPAWSENTVHQLIAHATAEMDAEIERLRAEVERLTGHLAAANDDHEQFERQWYLERDRAERLVEALIAWHEQATDKGRRERAESPGHSHNVLGVWDDDNGKYAGVKCAQCALWFEASRLRAALDQEVGNG